MRTIWWTLVVLGACRVEVDRSDDCQPDPIVQLDLCDGGCPYLPETPVCEITGYRDGTRGSCRQDGVTYDVFAHPEGDGEARYFFDDARLVAASFPARDPVCDDLAWFGRILDACAPTGATVPFACELPDTGDTDTDTDVGVDTDTDTPHSGTVDTAPAGYCVLTPLESAPTCPGGVCPIRPAVDLCDTSTRQSPRVGECITARGRWDVLAWIDPVTGADVRTYFVPTAQMVGTSVNLPGSAVCTELWGPTALQDCEDGRVVFTAVDCTVDTGPTGVVDTAPVDTDTDTDSDADTAPEVLDTQPGALRSAAQLRAGELTITELHVDPAACADSLGEYVEILNTSPWTVDLTGLVLGDGTTTTPIVGSPLLFPGQRTVSWADSLVGCLGATIPHGARHDVPPTMPDAGGVFELLTPAGVLIDQVDFTTFRLDPASLGVTRHGYAIHLAPGVSEDAVTNDDEASWCLGDQPLGTVDFGSPMVAATGCWTEPVDTAPIDSSPGGHSDSWSECGPGDTCSFQDTDTDTDVGGFQGPVGDACPPVGCPTIHPCMPFTEEAWEVCTLTDGTIYRAYRSRAYGFWATVWVLRSFGAAEEVVAIEADDGRVWGEVPGPCATLVDDDRGCHTFDPFDTAVFPGLRDDTAPTGDSADTADTPPTDDSADTGDTADTGADTADTGVDTDTFEPPETGEFSHTGCSDTADCGPAGGDSGLYGPRIADGELVITEILWKPTACPDRPATWIEVHNTGARTLDLANTNLEILTEHELLEMGFYGGSTPIGPGDYVAVEVASPEEDCSIDLVDDVTYRSSTGFGRRAKPFVPGHVRLNQGHRTIDTVPARDWSIPTGASLALSGTPDAAANDSEGAWCVGGGGWVRGPNGGPTADEGTPGRPNQCGLSAPDTGAVDTGDGPTVLPPVDGIDTLQPGDVVITELHTATFDCGGVQGGRYLEVQNRAGRPIDLTGLEVRSGPPGVPGGSGPDLATLVPWYGRGVLGVGERAVIPASFATPCHDVDIGWYAAGWMPMDPSDIWTLATDSQVLDTVDATGWVFSTRAAKQAIDPVTAAGNDDPASWCHASTPLPLLGGGAGDEFGTPYLPADCAGSLPDDTGPSDTDTGETGTTDTDTGETGTTDTDTDTPLPDTGPVDDTQGDTCCLPTDTVDTASAAAASVGDLVITEIMWEPLDCGPGNARWIEVVNVSSHDVIVDRTWVEVTDGTTSPTAFVWPPTAPRVLAPNERLAAAVGASGSPCVPGVEEPGWRPISTGDFRPGLVTLVAPTAMGGTVVVDAVDARGWTVPQGASLALSPDRTNAIANNAQFNWCVSVTVIPGAIVDLGTPGAPNVCGPTDSLVIDTWEGDSAACGGTLLDWCGGPCPTAMDLDVSCDPNLTDSPWFCGQYDGTSFSRWDEASGGHAWWFDQEGTLVAVEEQAGGQTCVYGEVPTSCPIASPGTRTCDPGIVDTAEPLACPPEPEVHRSYVVGSLLDAPACATPENCPLTLAAFETCDTTAHGALEWTCDDYTILRLVDEQPANGAWLLYYDALGDLTAVTTWTAYGPSLPYEVQVYGTAPCGCLDVTQVGVWEPRLCDTVYDTCCDGHSGIDTSAPPPADTAIDTGAP